MKLPVCSCEVIRDSTSLRSNRSPAQASSRKRARWLDSRSSAERKRFFTCCHLSGVIRNSDKVTILRSTGAATELPSRGRKAHGRQSRAAREASRQESDQAPNRI